METAPRTPYLIMQKDSSRLPGSMPSAPGPQLSPAFAAKPSHLTRFAPGTSETKGPGAVLEWCTPAKLSLLKLNDNRVSSRAVLVMGDFHISCRPLTNKKHWKSRERTTSNQRAAICDRSYSKRSHAPSRYNFPVLQNEIPLQLSYSHWDIPINSFIPHTFLPVLLILDFHHLISLQ